MISIRTNCAFLLISGHLGVCFAIPNGRACVVSPDRAETEDCLITHYEVCVGDPEDSGLLLAAMAEDRQSDRRA